MNNYADLGGFTMSRNTLGELVKVLIVLQILALLPFGEAQQPGICPSQYGPFEPNPFGEPSCQNMMEPGSYIVKWQHGAGGWWNEWGQLDMQANMKYLVTYDSMGQVSIEESEDSSLTGYTVICCSNQGPDAFVFCLEPVSQGSSSQESGTRMTEMIMGYQKSGYKVYLDGNYVGADGENGDPLDGVFTVYNIPCWGNHVIVVDDGVQSHTLDYYFGCEEGYSITVEDFEYVTEESRREHTPGTISGQAVYPEPGSSGSASNSPSSLFTD
jgi:hypothetical protein